MDTFLNYTKKPLRKDIDEEGKRRILEGEWNHLRKKCKFYKLEDFYKLYFRRTSVKSILIFILVDAVVLIANSALLLGIEQNSEFDAFDLTVYIIGSIISWLILSINLFKKLFVAHRCTSIGSSWLAVMAKISSDFAVTGFHSFNRNEVLRLNFSYYIVSVIYVFLPLPDISNTIILGVTSTAIYVIAYGFNTYRRRLDGHPGIEYFDILVEAIFHICLNVLGVYARLVQEIAVRITLIDREQCIEESLALRNARDQEESLLLSIIPRQIASKIKHDVRLRIEHEATKRQSSLFDTSLYRKLFIQPHYDVSILYADVVHFTHLTTTLDVKTLVETLHDLFVSFDLAAEDFNVLRIKFLGDCYYCVAGISQPDVLHAKSCVELGLQMIRTIRNIKEQRNLDIDMRIGVHSGEVFSGIIGACKWQFDIWSNDVDIANHLESTGVAGLVHVSEQTLNLLEGEYTYTVGTESAKNDPVLSKHKIRSYLIEPRKEAIIHSKPIVQVKGYDTETTFLNLNYLNHKQVKALTRREIYRELKKMPLSRFMKGSKREHVDLSSIYRIVSPLFLIYKDLSWELMFMKEPDMFIKYSVLLSAFIFIAVFFMQVFSHRQPIAFWAISSICWIIIIGILYVTWYKRLYIRFISERYKPKPTDGFTYNAYTASEFVQSNILARISVFLAIVFVLFSCSMMQLVECDTFREESRKIDTHAMNEGMNTDLCCNPWAITECVSLTICICCYFHNVPFILKTFTGIVIVNIYVFLITFEYDIIYEKSRITNLGVYSEYSHLLALVTILLVHHWFDRQTEFIMKVDYNWRQQLLQNQEDANVTNNAIKTLIHTILPVHVADRYITKKLENELYYEEYADISVLFATIKSYDTQSVSGLRVLNEIICDFDEVLNTYRGLFQIEKIKVSGWTYMAACGLNVTKGQYEMRPSQDSKRDTILHLERLSTSAATGENNVVYIMANFALDLLRIMQLYHSEESKPGLLQIGISHGEVMAGVVGSFKPHYDIWGNTVNMASRMDSTGEAGRIQVTQRTAAVLESSNIKCTYRGMTYVKGVDKIPTYFINVDENFEFVKVDPTL